MKKIDKRKLPTDLELAKGFSAWFVNHDENKDVTVTLPDGAVYVNTPDESLIEHCTRNNLKIVHVKVSGVIKEENGAVEEPKQNAKESKSKKK